MHVSASVSIKTTRQTTIIRFKVKVKSQMWICTEFKLIELVPLLIIWALVFHLLGPCFHFNMHRIWKVFFSVYSIELWAQMWTWEKRLWKKNNEQDHRTENWNLGRMCWFVCRINRSENSDFDGHVEWFAQLLYKNSQTRCVKMLTRSIWNACGCVCVRLILFFFCYFGKWLSGCLTAYYT